MIAREAGRLTALLRNPADTTPLAVFQGDLASLLGRRPSSSRTDGDSVPVLYGGAGGRIPTEGLSLGTRTRETSLDPAAVVLSSTLPREAHAASPGTPVSEPVTRTVPVVQGVQPTVAQ